MSHLYRTHIPTSFLQKTILTVGSAAVAITNPARGGRERPRITNATVDLTALAQLSDGTLGREYLRFLEKLDTSPDKRPPVQFIDDADLAYVMQRYRETHDLYHTVLQMPTTMLGEVIVKWYEGLQFGLPMCVFGGVFGALRLLPKQRQKYMTTHLQWALRNARKSAFLLNVYWEKHWHETLTDLRKELNIDEPPK